MRRGETRAPWPARRDRPRDLAARCCRDGALASTSRSSRVPMANSNAASGWAMNSTEMPMDMSIDVAASVWYESGAREIARARVRAGRSACWGDVAWRAHHVAVPERVLAGALEDGLRDLYVGRCGEGGADVDEADASRLCRGPALNLFLKVALMEDHLVVRLAAEHAAEAAVALGEERAVVLAAADEGEDDILHVRRAGHHRLECADGAKGEQQRGWDHGRARLLR